MPIDTTLAEQGGKLRPKALAEGALVELSAGGTDPFVKMSADGKSYALRWPTPLPKPAVKGSVATYTDAAGVGADLVVTALPTGFRHEVVLRQRPPKLVELRIGVEDAGLTLTEGKGGRLLLKGKDKKLVASAARPAMWDASAKGRRPLAKSAEVATEVAAGDSRTELVLKPDHQFLTDPGTIYPVRMQPMAVSTISEDIALFSTDTVDWPASPDSAILIAGVQSGQKVRSHLRFNTGSLQGQTVTDAKLSLFNMDSSACGASVGDGLQVRRVTSAWDVNNLYWANKPTSTTEDAQINRAGYGVGCADGAKPLEWSVTGIAQDWAAGAANHGLVVQSPAEANTGNWRYLTASEDIDFNVPPKLTITTSGPASQPTVSAPAITPAQTVNGTTVTTSLTPQLAATVADTASGNLTGQFEVEHDPATTGQGTGQIWTGASPAVTSGGQATVSVPAGKLTDGWKIRWRVRAANAAASTTSAWSEWQTATVDVPNPTVGAFQVTPSQVVNGVTVTTSLTPALHATVTDPAAQPVRAEFELEHDPAAPAGQGTGQIWAGAVDNVDSATQASIAVPADKLSDGWKVRWRVRAVNTATTVGSPWSDWQALAVDVPDPVSEPAVGALQVSPSEQVDGATVTPTVTPALLAQVSDPAGKPLRAEVEVEHDPAAPAGQGTGQIWSGSADNVPAGAQASIAVPADTLSDGWKVRWRGRAVSATAASAWSEWQSFAVSLPKPTATGLTITPSKVVDGVTVTDTLTPTLQATLTHPTGQSLRAEAEIEHDPAAPNGQGTGQIWAGAVDNVASGTQASIAVPAGTLADGWKVRWRVRAVAGDASSAWSDWQQITVDVIQPGEEPLAQTTEPVIRTDQSFTAAAWLRWSDKDGHYIVTDQRGTHHAPFRLGNTAEHGLVFTFTNADATDATVEGVLSGVEPPVDEWFHLAGTYDATTRTATLYLNGTQAGTAQLSFPAWNAQAPLRIGAAMAGSIDEVQIYQRPFSADEVASVIASVTAPAPVAATAPQKTASTQAAAQSGDFDYNRLKLEDCMASPSETGYADYDSRIRELPYNSCWSAYLYVQDFEQDPDSGNWRKANARGAASGTSASKSWGKQILDEILDGVTEPFDDDDAFRFRATWIIHSYLGDQTGNAVVDGAGTSLKPTDLKMFVRLDDFAVVDKDGRVKYSAGQLSGLPIQVMVDQGSSSPTTDCGDAAVTTADVSEWRAHPDATAIFHPKLPASGVAVCSILPAVNIYTDDGTFTLYLWNQKVLDESGKTIGIRRHGSDSPYDRKWVPNFRCDRKVFGAKDPDVEDRFGGCVNTRAKRVWVMSKSRDTQWTQITEHIEAALNPSNKQTFPPRRPGHDWSQPSYPPPRNVPGKEPEDKAIPGDWAAPRDAPAGRPLTRGTAGVTNTENRKHFQQIDLHMDVGTPEENHWLLANVAKPYYINLCKYYERDKYPNPDRPLVLPYKKTLSCDEYPFASVKEGAATAQGNYSLRVVGTEANRLHGSALNKFNADFRVGEGNKFWVLIED
ncbi:LamG-like jellyroll fold domain-containing protein [Nonomuraea sp. NPDC049480]|uniref:LamG-like jellyroll fold domain-containing protein n=1 Tax=Nonomuraea sp. NPDC049480 TaxID=3364353 RepID=UPI0037ACE240